MGLKLITVRLPSWQRAICFGMFIGAFITGDRAQAAPPEQVAQIGEMEGYVAKVRLRNGTATLKRHGYSVQVEERMNLLEGDEIFVSGDATLELSTATRRLILNAAHPSYRVTGMKRPAPSLLNDLPDAIRSLLVIAPPGVAHTESKGAGLDCAEPTRESQGAVDLHPVGSLDSEMQILPDNLRNVSLAWLGGQPPYRLRAGKLNSKSQTEIGSYCVTSVDNIDFDFLGNTSDIVVTISDAVGRNLNWNLHFVKQSAFNEMVMPKAAMPATEPLSEAIAALASNNKRLHLAGATMLSELAGQYFIAWRLSQAVKNNEIKR